MVKDVEIVGAEIVIKNMNRIADGVSGQGLVPPMRQSTLIVTSEAKRLAPVDAGRLRSTIAPEVNVSGGKIEGIVGTPVKYAPFMELGTRPHYPPLAALQVWARRHNVSARAVQLAIGKYGLKPRRFLQGAFENNTAKINQIFNDYVKDLTN